MKSRFTLSLFFAGASACLVSTIHATTYTWDGTNNAPWSDAKWSDGTNSAINWVNGGGNDAVVNSGDVWSPIGIGANSLTIGDGVGDANSASARFATNNAFWGITSITINSDGFLGGSANTTSHLLTVNLNGGTIGGGDNGGDAAFYGVIALHGPVNVNGGANTSTISTTGGGILLVGPTAGVATEFNVADGAAAVDLDVSGNFVHRTFGDSEKLLKTGAGTMVLRGANSYAGGTTVNAGTLSIRGGSAMSSDGSVTINGGVLEVVQTLGGGGGDYNWYWGVDSTEIKTGGKLTINSHSHIRNLTLSGGELASTGVDPSHGYGGWVLDDSTTVNGGVTSIISAQEVNAQNGGFDVAAGSNLNVTGTITTGSVTKSGTGTMVLSGANTYTGTTSVNAGKLLVNGSTASGSAVSVASGATLGGTGTVGGTLAVTGILAPGDGGIESLDVSNTVTWKGASSAAAETIWQFDLGTGNTADLLNITGDFTKDDSAGSIFRFDFMNSNVNGTFKLVDWTNVTNFLATDFSYTNLGGGRTGTFSFNGSSLEFTAVPEPTSALAGLLITAGLLRRRRR